MAKAISTTTDVVTSAIVLTTHRDGHTVTWDSLPDAARAYLAQYGMNKSLQDAASGTAKAASDAFKAWQAGTDSKESKAYIARQAKAFGILTDAYNNADDYASAVALAQKESRLADILSGEVEVGTTGPRLRGIDAIMRDIAIERLKAAYGGAGLKWPQESKAIAELVQRFLAKYEDETRAEAERRMDEASKAKDKAKDILGDLGL